MVPIFVLITIFVSFVFMYIFYSSVAKESPGDRKMQDIADTIRKSAFTFMRTEYQYIGLFVLAVAVLLYFLPGLGLNSSVSFIIGSVSSAMAGLFGMAVALKANVRTTNAAKRNLNSALKVSFNAGSTVGLGLVVTGVIGLLIISYIYNNDISALIGYSFGVASIALFARVGGGIFTKAADVGADLVGKVEAGIPEDDPRNPAVIADNVGDNVGDTAGMGADLFDSLIVNTVAAMAIGMTAAAKASVSPITEDATYIFPIIVVCAGLLASIVGTFFARTKGKDPSKALNSAFLVTCAVMIAIVYFMNNQYFADLKVFYTIVIGVVAGTAVGKLTEYYTSDRYRHVKGIAESSKLGAAGNIIHGISVGHRSTMTIVGILLAAIFSAYYVAGLYGIAMAGVGMLGLAAIIMAIDVFGPIVDNAGGIAEMAGLPASVRKTTDKLDMAGNTTAAIGKGFAIGSAALAALALLTLFAEEAGLHSIDLLKYKVMIGLFIGAIVPFRFTAYTLLAVNNAASKIADEVRRQFKTIKGIMEGKAKPDYKACIVIATNSALKEMIVPSILVIGTPIVVGLVFGAEALGGALAGTLITGIMLGIQQSNSGGAWDNAKKFIEKGSHGGKGSETHKASVVGDTVGDPSKDTSGPSLNIVIKLTILVATVFVTFF
ncbi:sodium-translocating pyrophosphatase [Candidatus Woesearchaeota archaeon]|nr:sodium-translocating pyrophosphatase [Candidatus Woesearchaeota archaeon]